MDLEEIAEEVPYAGDDQLEAAEPHSESAVAQDDSGRRVRPRIEETFPGVPARVADVEEQVRACPRRSSTVASGCVAHERHSLLLGLGGQRLVGL